jgi:ATPase subunit of ABC transporter with duplicated ATPase domains
VVDVSGLDVSIRGVRLLEDASLTILRGAKVCLLGANGSGKSTLVRLIASGKIKTKVHDVACVSQELEASERSALETLQECDHVSAELMNEEEKLLKAMDDDGSSSNKLTDEELVKAAQRLGEISELLNQRGAYDASSNARRILTGLGFDDRKMNTPLSTLSGGWRMRASLAIALFISPGLLLLDEPTNHLDLPATIWLASYLNSDRCKKTSVLMVTHSADFVSEVGTYTSHKILLAFSSIFAHLRFELFNKSREGFLVIPIRATHAIRPNTSSRLLPIQKTDLHFQNPSNALDPFGSLQALPNPPETLRRVAVPGRRPGTLPVRKESVR